MEVNFQIRKKAEKRNIRSRCSSCQSRKTCLSTCTISRSSTNLSTEMQIQMHLISGETLYHHGNHFHGLYAIKSGVVKCLNILHDSRSQISDFYMAGEVFGFDGISTGKHTCTTVALEDSEVCVIPLDQAGWLGLEAQNTMYKLMGSEINRKLDITSLLVSMPGEERLATFLLNLSQRFLRSGFSEFNLTLPMTREEIGSFLGIRTETVCRLFTKLQDQGLLDVKNKNIRILDIERLRELSCQY